MDDESSFYLRRKQYLDNLKRKKNLSPLKQRMINILSEQSIEGLQEQIEEPVRCLKQPNFKNNGSSFSERFNKYLEENHEGTSENKKSNDKSNGRNS